MNKSEHENLRTLIIETVTLLCKNGLKFNRSFSVEGLLGITLDESDVFLVNIKETVRSALENIAAANAAANEDEHAGADDTARSSARKRRRRRHHNNRRSRSRSVSRSDESDQDEEPRRGSKHSRLDLDPGDIKREHSPAADDVIIVKEEGDDASYADAYNAAAGDADGYGYSSANQPPGPYPPAPPGGGAPPHGYDESQLGELSGQFDNSADFGMDESGEWRGADGEYAGAMGGSGGPGGSQSQFQKWRSLYVKDGDRFACLVCDKRYSCAPNVITHIRRAHEGRRFECPLCHRHFSTNNILRSHLGTQHATETYFSQNLSSDFSTK